MTNNTQHTHTRDRTRRGVLRGTITTAAVVGGLTAASGTALADSEEDDGEGFFDGNLVVGDDSARANTIAIGRAWASVNFARVAHTLDPSAADEITAELGDHFNEHSDDYREWINDRDLGGPGREIFELEIAVDDESSVVYLVADYDNGSEAYATAEMLDSETFKDEHDTDPDESSKLESTAARESPSELERFYDEFVEPDEDVSSSYITEMTTKYGGSRHISSTLLGDEL